MRKKKTALQQSVEAQELKSKAAQLKKCIRKFEAEMKVKNLAHKKYIKELHEERAALVKRMEEINKRFIQSSSGR